MPDQPSDPRHYEMKIPPEPQHENKEGESEKSAVNERAPRPQDTNVTRNEDNQQPARQSGR
jgi:hypothetical protein